MDYCIEGTPPRNLIKEWMLAEESEVQAEFDNIINLLQATENWNGLKIIHDFYREHVGLTEIRFDLTRTKKIVGPFWRYRPIGFRRPATNQFVLLCGCKKRMETYDPLDCLDLALDLRRAFENGRGTLDDHIFSYMA